LKFENPKAHERRLLLKLLLQNPTLDGKIVRYTLLKPFDTIINYADSQLWLEQWYDFRQIDWASELEYPEFTNKEVNRFLSL